MIARYSPGGFCPACGYRMDAGRCAECGRNVPRPAKRPPLGRRRRRLILAAIVLPLLGGAAYGVWYHGTELAVRFWPAWHLKRLGRGSGWLAEWSGNVNVEQLITRENAESEAQTAREIRIRTELADASRPAWAGLYFASPGRSILLAPGNGFSYHASTCRSDESNHGDVVEVTDDLVRVKPAIDPDSYEIGPDQTFVRIDWAGHPCLVELRELAGFANGVNARESTWGCYSMHPIDDEGMVPRWEPPDWKPRLPAQFASWLHDLPLVATVTAVKEQWNEGDRRFVTLTLNVGADARAFVGMLLYFTDDPGVGVTVTSLGQRDCEAIFIDDQWTNRAQTQIKAGWRFVSRIDRPDDAPP